MARPASLRKARLLVGACVAGALVASLVPGRPAQAVTAAEWAPPGVQRTPSVTTHPFVPKPVRRPDLAAAASRVPMARPKWPAGSADLDLARPDASTVAMPVRVSSAAKGGPARLRVAIADRATTARAGVEGMIFSLTRTDGSKVAAALPVTIDYSSFAGAYGGGWASRLHLVSLPACALTTPTAPGCRTATPVPSRNDSRHQTVSAAVPTSGAAATTLAVAAGASGNAGSFAATSLTQESSWQVGAHTGDFNWSLPMRVPPAVGGPRPALAISYSSGSVDGRTASTNNQPSWVGEGHSLETGFVERKYVSCAEDMAGGNNTVKTGDLCWKTDNAALVLGGHSSDLVKDAATGTWRLKNDDASRIEKLSGATNGDNDTEYWRLTTSDGTQYHFGLGKRYAADTVNTNSTYTVPVFGNQAGEPCNRTTFATSYCAQAWRWNLDYVVDTNGNSMTYNYTPETNYYGRNLGSGVSGYVRGGFLNKIEYGESRGTEHTTAAPAQVVFTVDERCTVSAAACAPAQLTAANAASWPDVPFDQICASSTSCPNRYSPTFFSRKRLTDVATQVRSGTGYRTVDDWTLAQTFPDPGDATARGLWLATVQHTGVAGGSLALPPVRFFGALKPNRVDGLDNAPPMNKWRVGAITTESGTGITVNYTPPECFPGAGVPSTPSQDTRRCFPVFWAAEGQDVPTLNYFHKYLVAAVEQDDLTTDAPTVVTNYDYLGAPAWHYDDNELTEPRYRTYGDWRGYSKVQTRTGASGSQTLSTSLFMRGMHDDPLPGGAKRSVTVIDSEGVALADANRLNGYVREEIQHNGAGGAEVTGTINDPWISAATATNGSDRALMLGTAKSRTRIALAAGGYRRTEVSTTFDAYGMPDTVSDLGDTGVATDNLCTRTYYARNAASAITSPVSRTETVSVACAATPSRPADVVADARTYYDGLAWGAAPTRGSPTKTEAMASWSGGPVYAQRSRADYDGQGRMIASYNGANTKTSTVTFTPTAGGPVTGTTTTNALGHASTTTVDPAWGSATATVDANARRTDLTYDPIGRLTAVWLPGRAKATATANLTFGYTVSQTAPTVVSTKELRNDGSYTASFALFDGLLRPRQTQEPAANGSGRLVADTIFDFRGNPSRQNGPFYDSAGAASGTLLALNDQQLPAQEITSYDGANRPTVQALVSHSVELWRTTLSYGGDRTSVTPPAGGTPTTTIVDARGRTVALQQFHGASPSGASDETKYTYTPAGQPKSVTDPAGNTWSSGYDLLGRSTSAADPDKGSSTMTYDTADRLTSSTDARGQVIAFDYDTLDRKTAEHTGSATGPVVASWVYDTLAKGQPTSSTRIDSGNSYVKAVTGYDAAYRPTGTSVTVPAAEGGLAGTYLSTSTYNIDGGMKTQKLPTIPGLPSETVGFDYDGLGQPIHFFGAGSYVSATTYSPYGQPLRYQMGNTAGHKVYETFAFDEGTRRLASTKIDREGVATSDSTISYGYDPAGNVTSATDVAAGLPTDTQCFGYDYLRRLTEAWTPSGWCGAAPSVGALGGPAPYWQSFGYDLTGNRTSLTTHAAAGDTVSTGSYPAAGAAHPHFLTARASTGPGGTSSDTYTPDAIGNTATRTLAGAGQTLTWDAEGHLGAVNGPGGVTGFLYDAEGGRLIRRDPTATTLYLGDAEVRLDKATGALSSTRYYSHGGAAMGVRTAAGLQLQIADPHNTATLAIDDATGALTRRRMDPFGQQRDAVPPSWAGERGFVGGTIDPSLGLTHLGAREYDPALGRFLSVDPIMKPADPQQLNGYSYANNNPTSMSDPDGLEPGSWCNSGDCTAKFEKRQSPSPGGTRQPRSAGQVDRHGPLAYSTPESYAEAATQHKYGCSVAAAAGCPVVDRAVNDYYFARANQWAEAWRSYDSKAYAAFLAWADKTDRYGCHHVACAIETIIGVLLGAMALRLGGRRGGDPFTAPLKFEGPLAGRAAANTRPGAWEASSESMSGRAAAYQERITGHAAGSVYKVNGVKFDGFTDGVLQEAKGPGYTQFVRNGEFQPWYRGADAMVGQAQRQLGAAGGSPITWSFAESDAAAAVRNLFSDRGISGINVVWAP